MRDFPLFFIPKIWSFIFAGSPSIFMLYYTSVLCRHITPSYVPPLWRVLFRRHVRAVYLHTTLYNVCFTLYHYRIAFCFVSSCYTILCTTIMTCGFLQQCIFISQNVTSQEFHVATKKAWLKFGFIVKNNRYYRGVIRNWITFLTSDRTDHIGYM